MFSNRAAEESFYGHTDIILHQHRCRRRRRHHRRGYSGSGCLVHSIIHALSTLFVARCSCTLLMRGRHKKMNRTPDFHFLIVVTPLTQECIQE